MFLFNKKKDEPAVSSPRPSSAPRPIVDADDFFSDITHKKRPKKINDNVEAPEITGLRESPPPIPTCTISNINQQIATDVLPDKTSLPVTNYYADISEIDIENIDTSSLREPVATAADNNDE